MKRTAHNSVHDRPRRRRRIVQLAAAIAVAVVSLALGGSAAIAAPPTPPFGPAIDAYARYDPQDTCDRAPKPGVVGFSALLDHTYGAHVSDIPRRCGSGGTSEHKEGRALDYMLKVNNATDAAIARDVLNWLLATDKHGNRHAMARRLGIMYIIWNRQEWDASLASRGWQPYHRSNPHTDHIHVSFSWAGALQRTTWWTSNAISPTPKPDTGPSTPPARAFPVLRDIGVYADANVLRGLSVIKAGTQVQVLCWTTGQRIANLDVWDRIKWGAGTAYVHDRWVDMGGRFPRDIGIPTC